jgi:hypothetical protein
MNSRDLVRLLAISTAVIVLQQSLLLAIPEWRAGLDFYIAWLLVVSASRGLAVGTALALWGGFLVDAPSVSFGLFHTIFYLIPVTFGALFTSHLITEYKLLASLVNLSLLILKVVLMLLVALALGLIPGPQWIFKLSFLPVLCNSLLVFILWPNLTALVPAEHIVNVGGTRFGR